MNGESQARPQGSEQPKLFPGYEPAKEDSVLMIRFAGNTAQIIDFVTKNIDAFQILAVAHFLEMKGKQAVVAIEQAEIYRQQQLKQQAEAEAERKKIMVAGRIPSEEELGRMPPGMGGPKG